MLAYRCSMPFPPRRLRIGVLDLLADAAPRGWDRLYATHFRRQFTGIMPQAVAVWCRQLGHDVSYATYYGQALPHTRVPRDLDILFVSAFTKASALAYALARLFGRGGTLTVLGGPHAHAFPDDALRFFDIVVDQCDRATVADIVQGRHAPHSLVSAAGPLVDLPTVEERMPELRASSLGGRVWRAVPVLSSVGCPYTCNFCVDWNRRYVRLPSDRLAADLKYIAAHHPGAVVAYHDPNFGVQFDETLDVIEAVPPDRRNPYVIESSLSIVKEGRLERLKQTRCAYLAAGVESWADYSNKSGSRAKQAEEKLEHVIAHFEMMRRYIAGFQANFVFGTDADSGAEPLRMTKAFAERVPFVWPGVNIPTPFGGTPLFDQLVRERRMLTAMPFAFYYNPYLTFIPAHYSPVEYYRNLIDLFASVTSGSMWRKRLTNGTHPLVKFIHSVQALGMTEELRDLRRILAALESDSALRAFQEGKHRGLPEFYHRRLDVMLGEYGELLPRKDRSPVFERRETRSSPLSAGSVGQALAHPR
jgi:hypothetical protein